MSSDVLDLLTEFFIEEYCKMGITWDATELKDDVVKRLVSNYDFEMEEAEEAVSTSMGDDPDLWNPNAESSDLAKYLASEGNDD